MTNVLAYSNQPILGAGLRSILEGLADFQLIECCETTDALKSRVEARRPELLLIELTPGISLNFLRDLMDISGGARVVIWIDNASPEFLSQALAMGVRGILRIDQSIAAYGQCLRGVAAGEVWLDRELAGNLLSRKQVPLTPRERQLIGHVSKGLKNKEIAYAMGIGEGTVKVYLSRLYLKVGAHDRFDLALMGLRNVEANQCNALDRVEAKPVDRAVPFSIPSFLSTGRIPVAA